MWTASWTSPISPLKTSNKPKTVILLLFRQIRKKLYFLVFYDRELRYFHNYQEARYDGRRRQPFLPAVATAAAGHFSSAFTLRRGDLGSVVPTYCLLNGRLPKKPIQTWV
jgi:hypothetical protein